MLSRIMLKGQRPIMKSLANKQTRVFSTSKVGLNDMADIAKVHYTEEFDQGLTEA